MRDLPTQIPLWMHPVLMGLLSPLAIYLGWMWDWTPGAACLALLVFPACLTALTGHTQLTSITGLMAAAACLLDAGLRGPLHFAPEAWVFPGFSAGVLLGLSGAVVVVADNLQQRLSQLNQRTTDFLRQFYEKERDGSETAATVGGGNTIPSDGSVAAPATLPLEPLNYPMLLLTLQDLGRRISTNLDLDSLLPTIVSIGTGVLKCGTCQVYLWNSKTQTLRNPLARSREHAQYVPLPGKGMAGWVLDQRHILTRTDVDDDYALHSIREDELDMPSAVAPLTAGGELLGLIVVHDAADESAHFVKLLYFLANLSGLAIKNAQLFKRIEELARRDGLTGLLNHASFQHGLDRLVADTEQQAQPLAVVLSDVDHFKRFNDTHGHQAGDHVLREVARIWQMLMPESALLARYGGEEFVCALPGVDSTRAAELAETLRATLEMLPISFEGRALQVTASFGVAEWGRSGRTAAELVKTADEAMYKAKQGGRNRVVLHAGINLAQTAGGDTCN